MTGRPDQLLTGHRVDALVENARFIYDTETHDVGRIARRLGMTTDALERALARRGIVLGATPTT